MKHVTLLPSIPCLLFLISCASENVERGRWKAVEEINKWGEGAGTYIAVSSGLDTVDGKEVEMVVECVDGKPEMSILTTSFFAPVSGVSRTCDRDGRCKYPEYFDVRIDGREYIMGFYRTDISNEESKRLLKLSDYDSDNLRRMWKAKEFKIIFPTERYGDLLFDINMRGARRAMASVCPASSFWQVKMEGWRISEGGERAEYIGAKNRKMEMLLDLHLDLTGLCEIEIRNHGVFPGTSATLKWEVREEDEVVYVKVPVSIDGAESSWLVNEWAEVMGDRTSRLETLRALRDAKTFFLSIPTVEWGDLTYNFDMSGGKEAINASCLNL